MLGSYTHHHCKAQSKMPVLLPKMNPQRKQGGIKIVRTLYHLPKPDYKSFHVSEKGLRLCPKRTTQQRRSRTAQNPSNLDQILPFFSPQIKQMRRSSKNIREWGLPWCGRQRSCSIDEGAARSSSPSPSISERGGAVVGSLGGGRKAPKLEKIWVSFCAFYGKTA